MGVHVAAGPSLYHHCPSSPCARKEGAAPGHERSLAWQIDERRSPFLGAGRRGLSRSRSFEPSIAGKRGGQEQPVRRPAISATTPGFLIGDDDDNEELLRLHLPWEPEWPVGDAAVVPASVERNASSVELPMSLRLIKRRRRQLRRWEEGLRAAGDSARCSVKKAFSSMVFIIRELHCYALQTRHALVPGDLQGVLARVRGEMHASFVWLFQQVFSSTPTLMVSVMLLLVNFTVYSIDNSVATAAAQPRPPAVQSVVAVVETHHQSNRHSRLDPAAVKKLHVSGRTASGGRHGGGGGKTRPVAGASDDGRRSWPAPSEIDGFTVIPDGASTTPETGSDASAAAVAEEEDEGFIWGRVVEEANRMQALLRGDLLMGSDTVNALVAPVTVQIGEEDAMDYFRTNLEYQQAVAADPENPLLLANFAQFLYVVLRDLDRAEYYFKRAARVKPTEAEALSRYAAFLWVARNDLEAAEEKFLEAVAAEPSNTHYAAAYAHFLWSNGGEDTCSPLNA